jgi:uncharacterized protein (DUF342 family)
MTNSSNPTPDSNKKYLEPTLHFSRKRILIGTEERAEKVTVTELVKKNQALLSFPQFKKFEAKGFEKSPIRAGKYTKFSDDGETLFAETIGYPRVDVMKQGEGKQDVLLISLTPLVKVSNDKMTGTLLLHPPISKDYAIRKEPLPELLKEAGILFGIDQTALQKAQEIIAEGYKDFHEIPIAFGQAAETGVDAYLQFAIEVGPIPGKLMEDGTIDFRERRIMIAVAEDELLATKIPEIPGATGMDVQGSEIEPEGGTELVLVTKNDVSFSEDTGEIRASKAGILTLVNDCEIKVCAKQEIPGDVDYNTGHINSLNCVIVNGAVQPGFKVSTGGNLEIKQEVMSGILKSEANIVIKGGITGKNTDITAHGDVDFKFIEQGKIHCDGNLIMRKQSYYSNLSALGAIRCKEGTTIIGGDIVAGGALTVANVGSPNGKPALLAAGVDIERLHLQRELSQDLIRQQDEIIQWLQRYGGSAKSKKIRKMEALVDETKMKLLKLNLIPGTGLYSRVGDDRETGEEVTESEDGESKAIRINKVFIDLKGTVFQGTELRIGNAKMLLDKNISKRRLKLNKSLKHIFATVIK